MVSFSLADTDPVQRTGKSLMDNTKQNNYNVPIKAAFTLALLIAEWKGIGSFIVTVIVPN